MAKGLRSSTRKRNKAKLRATVYGPVVDARTERLSAKLQELASNPKPSDSDIINMQVDNADLITKPEESKPKEQKQTDDMDVDDGSTNTKSVPTKSETTQSNRVQKKTRNKKRPSIAFPQHPQKARRMAKKK